MEKLYKAFVHKGKTEGYGITFPDFPGCVSEADTLDEVIAKGKGILQVVIDIMFENNQDIPEPGTIDDKWISGECDDIECIAVLPADIPGKNLRINVSMADYVIERVDRFAKSHGQTRSGVLSNAALKYIA